MASGDRPQAAARKAQKVDDMTRVDENREAQRLDEQKRLQEQDKAKSAANRQQFGNVVAQKQVQTRGQVQTQQRNTGNKQTSDRQGNEALLARAGISSQKFGSMLETQGKTSTSNNESNLKARNTESRETEKTSNDKQAKIEQGKVEKQGDQLAAVSRDDRQKQSGGDSDAGGSKEQQKGMFAGSDPTMAAQAKEMQGPAASQQAQGTAGTKIPQAVIDQLVQRVLVGLNKEGLGEMHIQFKEGVLGGGSLQISSKDGKINAKFTVPDQNTRRLLRASQGELERAFGSKGLTLANFAVESTA
jgi:hypothetical protein